MNKAYKQGCMWGCGLVTLVLVAIVGTGTWYAAQMTKDFKAVKASEKTLLATVASDSTYQGSLTQPPAPERVATFLEIRRGLHERRMQLAHEVGNFRTARNEDQGGPLGFFKSLRAGTELAPVYAGFWQKRNDLMSEKNMGPREYTFLYRLLYFTWLGHDPNDGNQTPAGTAMIKGKNGEAEAHSLIPPRALDWQGGQTVLDSTLAAFRDDLEMVYSPSINPLETLFVDTAQK